MGRLENIIARNRRPHGLRATFGFFWRGLFLLLILGLLIFTDWALTDDAGEHPGDASGQRPGDASGQRPGDPSGARPSARPPVPGERRLDGVQVLRPPARAPQR